MFIRLALILLFSPFISFGKICWLNDLISFLPSKFYIDSIHANEYYFKTSENAQISIQNDTLTILCIDTVEIELIATHILTKKEVRFKFKPKPNPFYNKSWHTKDFMAIKSDEAQSFMNFYFLKYLHKPFPEFELNDPFQHVYSKKNLLGKTTLIDFWYYGCSACMLEIPNLNKLLLAISNDSTLQLLSFYDSKIRVDKNKYLEYEATSLTRIVDGIKDTSFHLLKTPLTLIQLQETKTFNEELHVKLFPTKVIIDRNGIIRHFIFGSSRQDDTLSLLHKIKEISALYE
jgi:peroxiredoxin